MLSRIHPNTEHAMIRTFALGLLCCLLLAFGCIPSLHPTYRSEDVVFDPALLGGWEGEKDAGLWLFNQGDKEKTYRAVQLTTDGDDPALAATFDAHLVEVDGLRLLDLTPQDPQPAGTVYYRMHLLPVHTFVVVDQIEPTLRVRMLKPDWLGKLLEEQPDALKHEKLDDAFVLTAEPEQLQAFIRAHLETAEAWMDTIELTRVSAPVTQAATAPAQ
jgi:hypothetical protein